jgi:hypothetical protein
MRMLAVLLGCLVLGVARADVVADLYRGEAIVTGQENLEERERGFREALVEAVVKVSGDAGLAADPRLAPALREPQRWVARFEYEDRLAKKKLMDEQGTRERSYVLRVDFDPAAVDRLLADLGSRPWAADRPRLLVLLVVRDSVGGYLVAEDSTRGWGQREALAAISRRRGVPVVLPRLDAARDAELTATDGQPPEEGAVRQLAAEYAADAVLQGWMIMRADGQWDTGWTLQPGGARDSWRSDGTTFDRAIASGLEGSALRMGGLQ